MFINTFAYAAVDAVQDAKKQFVSTFIKHDEIGKILTQFVEAQTAYTKAAIDAGISASSQLTALATKKGK